MNAVLWVTIVTSILGAGGLASLATFLTLKPQREKISAEAKKINAEAADLLTGQALSLINPLHLEIERLQKEVGKLQGNLEEARSRVQELTQNLDDAHMREKLHLQRIQQLEDENATIRALRKNYEQ